MIRTHVLIYQVFFLNFKRTPRWGKDQTMFRVLSKILWLGRAYKSVEVYDNYCLINLRRGTNTIVSHNGTATGQCFDSLLLLSENLPFHSTIMTWRNLLRYAPRAHQFGDRPTVLITDLSPLKSVRLADLSFFHWRFYFAFHEGFNEVRNILQTILRKVFCLE
jgi:hypothetical protein